MLLAVEMARIALASKEENMLRLHNVDYLKDFSDAS